MTLFESYLDDASLIAEDLRADFSVLSGLLGKLLADKHQTFKRSTIYTAPVAVDLIFATAIYHAGYLDDDVRRALQVQIEQIASWDDQLPDPTPTTSQYARVRSAKGIPVACIVLPSFLPRERERGFYLISDSVGLIAALRDIPTAFDLSEADYITHCSAILDKLIFKPDIEQEIRRFSRSFREIKGELHSALIALNDHLSQLLDDKQFGLELAARFRALSGFEISPESPQTHKNKRAMREREVSLGAHRFVCEWHLKLQPHRDRIHFHSFDEAIGNGQQILIGIFCDHLPT